MGAKGAAKDSEQDGISDNEDRVLMAYDDYEKLEKRLETPLEFVCVTGVEYKKVAACWLCFWL